MRSLNYPYNKFYLTLRICLFVLRFKKYKLTKIIKKDFPFAENKQININKPVTYCDLPLFLITGGLWHYAPVDT